MEGFQVLGFPDCIGTIDGTNIPICALGGSPEQYGNRKNYSSIILRGTVDHRGHFIDTETGWSGKNHDASVFRNLALCAAMYSRKFVPGNATLTINGVSVPPLIISDGAYPMRRWLLKPYGKTTRRARERLFDRCLSHARNVVAYTFGRLKSRWHCLVMRLNAREKNVIVIMTAYVILHNICESRGYPIVIERRDPTPLLLDEVLLTCAGNDDHLLEQGNVVQDALVDHMYGIQQ